jgi:ATP-dependent helicase/nuclease subunit B
MGEGRDRLAGVFTIPAGVAFADALAAALLSRAEPDPLALARTLVLLPTRRACRTLREAFLRRTQGAPLLLPRMRPLGDLDADELLFADPTVADSQGSLDLPPAIAPLRRRLLLARLIQVSRAADALPADQALGLADALAALLDQVHTERLDFSKLADLVPDAFAAHWQITLDFLRVITHHWPQILKDEGVVDPAEGRNALLAAQTAVWRQTPPDFPVVAAGSTGSIPATADLLACIRDLPQGAVVLPGLDRYLGKDAIRHLQPSHPQYGMVRLLDGLDLDPTQVADWPIADDIPPPSAARAHLISLAFAPAVETDRWLTTPLDVASALVEVKRLDAVSAQAEAAAIALAMREVLETPGRTAALVTPDRDLGRRVAAELGRWGIQIDDSGGAPLDRTAVGGFLRLITAAVTIPSSTDLLALLKHPLCALQQDVAASRRQVRRLEIDLLRGAPAQELTSLISRAEAWAATKPSPGRDGVVQLLCRLSAVLAPLTALLRDRGSLRALVEAVGVAAEALATTDREQGWQRLWLGDAGEAAAGFLAELTAESNSFGDINGRDFPALLDCLLASVAVRPRYGRHPRLAVLGPLEARLQRADLLILGGLNEGTWPAAPPPDPWMSRPMRAEFGLFAHERRIGLAAHDFVQAFMAPQVLLTRAQRIGGAPTVPARWLQRLDAVLAAQTGPGNHVAAADDLAAWIDAIDRPDAPDPSPRPAPRPPLAARPRHLSVTAIPRLRQNPYGIYAERILALRELEPLDPQPEAADFGEIVHSAVERLIKEWSAQSLADPRARLLEIGRDCFGPLLEQAGVTSFWWLRFERLAHRFTLAETERRRNILQSWVEIKGSLAFPAPGGAFQLTGKADRIDRLTGGGLAILDYKTGTPPLAKHVASGMQPQLPLEAAIAEAGGFPGVPASPVAELTYWKLAGRGQADKPTSATGSEDPGKLAAEALAGLQRLIAAFDNEATTYIATPPGPWSRYDAYGHLARADEWSSGDDS